MLYFKRAFAMPVAAALLFGVGFGSTLTAFAQTSTTTTPQWWPECSRSDGGNQQQCDQTKADCQDCCNTQCTNGYFTCMDCCNQNNGGTSPTPVHCLGASSTTIALPHPTTGSIP